MKTYRRFPGDGSVQVVLNPDSELRCESGLTSGFKTAPRREPLPYNSTPQSGLYSRHAACFTRYYTLLHAKSRGGGGFTPSLSQQNVDKRAFTTHPSFFARPLL